jgi:hypothetical protein
MHYRKNPPHGPRPCSWRISGCLAHRRCIASPMPKPVFRPSYSGEYHKALCELHTERRTNSSAPVSLWAGAGAFSRASPCFCNMPQSCWALYLVSTRTCTHSATNTSHTNQSDRSEFVPCDERGGRLRLTYGLGHLRPSSRNFHPFCRS